MIGTIVILFLYFLPTFIVYSRSHSSPNSVMVLNLFLGWTLIGWVVALAWSLAGSNK